MSSVSPCLRLLRGGLSQRYRSAAADSDLWGGGFPWGDIGQVTGCQANLGVGDPLTGSDVAPVTMPDGFPYSLQELAFFYWFFGAPSLGVNGWFSDNGTFSTDAGPNCPTT
jgi:hypothetical protein